MKTRILILFTMMTACALTVAQVPRTIAFQATLKTTAGTPVDGDVSVTLSLYDVATGGTALWSEMKTVSAIRGVITTSLGEPTPFPSTVLFDRPYWVGVKVGGDAEMVPRLPIQSVPYALALPGVTQVAGGGALSLIATNVSGNFDVTGTLTARQGGTILGELDVVGGVYSRTLTLTSSRRYKNDIQPIKNALGTVSKLQGVRYNWDAEHGGKPDFGFIAEDVAKVIPELVTMEDDGLDAKGMDYAHLTALLVEGIKELRSENADLKTRLERLEQKENNR